MRRFYLDHNASSTLRPSARAAIARLIDAPPANAGSVHQEGQRARSLLERARRTVSDSVGHPGELVFTSGATEANVTVMATVSGVVAVGRLEHPSVLAPLEARDDVRVRWIDHDGRGRLQLDSLADALAAGDVHLVSICAANNELGNLNDIASVASMCAAAGAALHVDAAQVFGRLPLPSLLGVTYLSVSAHKIGGPVGVGALWRRSDAGLAPLLRGGHQERGARAGTENVISACAFAAVVETSEQELWQQVAPARDLFERRLVRDVGAVVNGDIDRRLPNTTNVSFPGATSEALVMALDLAGIACSSGSACSAGSVDVSPVIDALDLEPSIRDSAVRFSFGLDGAAEHVDEIVGRIERAVTACRKAGG